MGLMEHARRNDIAEVEATAEAEEEWSRRIEKAAMGTVYPKVKSWYWGTNIEGKPHKFLVLLEGFDVYQDLVREIARRGIHGLRARPGVVRGRGLSRRPGKSKQHKDGGER